MIFKPQLVAKILAGEKTMTRRFPPIQYHVGQVYAVQPGRGKFHAGHVLVTRIRAVYWWELTQFDVEAEGFEHRYDFLAYWQSLYPGPLPRSDTVLCRIEFILADRCDRCAQLEVPDG